MTGHTSELLQNLWDDSHAATLDEPGRLLYLSLIHISEPTRPY